MSRIRLILLSLLAAFAVSAVASASASATCYKVAEKETGRFETFATCVAETPVIAKGEWIDVSKLEMKLKPGEWCAKVKVAGTGNYEDNKCEKAKAGGEFIKVLLVKPECKTVELGDTCLYVNGIDQEDLGGTFPIQTAGSVASASELKVENGPTLKGTKVQISGEIDNTEDSSLQFSDVRITFTGVKVTNNEASEKNCEVVDVTGGVKERVTVEGGTGDNLDSNILTTPAEETFIPSEGGVFVKITVKTVSGKPTCPFAVTAANVTGEQTCKNVSAIEEEAVKQKLECTFAGSNLKFASKKAEFKLASTDIELVSKEKWALRQS